ncbi:MAG: NAD(+)/NADH kinase [Nitrospinales bacterium]
MKTIKSIGIFCKQKPAISKEVLLELTSWLRARKYDVLMDENTAVILGEAATCARADIPKRSQLIIVLGGDGTLLSVARVTFSYDVPLLPVNLGSLGFLTEVSLPELYGTLEHVLKGEYETESRMLLKAVLKRDGGAVEEFHVLNDVVINKGGPARIVNLEVLVNDQYMTSYRADGLIISTPTGSTAYSLSAGGPIIHPSMSSLLVSPICPFTLTNRHIVLPGQSRIKVKLLTLGEAVHITLDGQAGCDMEGDDVLEVQKADAPVKLIQAPGKNYYNTLRQKLHWGRPADVQKPDQGG